MRRYNRLMCGLLVALLHHAGWANQDDASKVLIDQGNFWLERNDAKRATEAWNKLLLTSPNSPDALYGLAKVELNAQRIPQARVYLERLKQVRPDSPLIAKLEQEISLGSSSGAASIAEARRLARAGELDEAVAKYRQVLGNQQPVGDLGREYYTNLGYTQGGLGEAIAGLRRLAEQSPNDAQVKLALARHLARNEQTRIEGVGGLEALSVHPDVGAEATHSWREALTWLSASSSAEQALLTSYLKKHPDDAGINEQLQQGVKQVRQQAARISQASAPRSDPLRERTDAAMKWLNAGDTVRAQAEFEAVLKQRANDSEALGGLGIVAMRTGNWQQAKDYLTRARKGNSAWQATLDSVQYWVEVDQARALLRSGKLAEARKVADRAAKRAPKEVAAEVLLADILLEEGKTAQATKAYRDVLERRPGDPQALQGLGQVARMSGDYAASRRMLEDALAQDPDNPWLRYQLALLYQDAGYKTEARGLVDGLLMTHPNDPDALYVSALLASDSQQWQATRDTLERIPTSQRTAAMNELYARANLQAQIAEAGRLAKAGRKTEALNWLAQVQSAAGNDFDVINAVAQAYVQMGETARGAALLQPLRAQGQARSADASIAYVGLLLASNQDVEASVVLRHLHTQNLTGAQRASLEDLTDSYRVRQADVLVERGDLVAAYDMVAPVLARQPNQPDAMASLARMYAAAGQGQQALQLYETVLRNDPNNPHLHLGLAQVSQQLKNHRQARNEADIAVSLAPEDIDVLTGAAQVYRLSGDTSEAAKLIQRAMALESRGSPLAYGQYAAGPAASSSANPFVGLPGQRSNSSLDGGQGRPPAPMPAAAQPYAGAVPIPVNGQSYGAAAQPPAAQQAYSAAVPPPVQQAAPIPYQPTIPAGAMPFVPAQAAAPGAYGAVPMPAGQAGNPFASAGQVAYAPQSALGSELDAIMQERSGHFSGGAEFRSRSGEAGTGKLDELQLPLEVSFPAGNGRVNLRATPVSISSGSQGAHAALTPPPAGMEIANLNPYAIDNDTQNGVGFSVGYEGRGFELDAGVTPLGFQHTDFTGGALVQGTLDDAGTVGYRVDVSRRPVTDSVLSFAGRRHRSEDLEWGGVSATGARATLSKDFGDAGIYGAVAWHTLRGNNVASNNRKEFNAGAYFHVIDELDSKLTTGVNVNAAFYDKNLSYYTYGHGGYFSPKHYYALSVPVTWAQRSGKFSYRVDGSIGLQTFKQDDAAVFPTRSDLQAQVQAVGADLPGIYGMQEGVYRGQSKTGVSYNVKATAEYRVDPKLALGATIGADNASDYKQWMGGVYLRYYFHPQSGLLDLPIKPHRTTNGDTFGR
ncbi:cellulose synthase subunit BcsC-related outer membrane protein [Pusillimonas sp.]|uniref:cellulose synthase subunit BcsC-related outer membrane protein n=1 Tax=Burkholderiales TaxID=80840 RepID=UPI0037CC15F7